MINKDMLAYPSVIQFLEKATEMNCYLIGNILITGINMIVLGMSIKLYTEYFKDKYQDKRRDLNKQPVERDRS